MRFAQVSAPVILVMSLTVSGVDAQSTIVSTDVAIRVNPDITLAGTLTLPAGVGPHPAVVLVSGSLADDRDASLGTFKPFALLAEHLAAHGIASLRYDDRGVGKSSGRLVYEYTADELAEDVLSAVGLLRKDNRIAGNHIGVLGHSFGAMLAPIVAADHNEIAYVVSMAGSAADPREINVLMRQQQLRREGRTAADIERRLSVERLAIAATDTLNDRARFAQAARGLAQEDFDALPQERRGRYANFDAYFATTWYGTLLPFVGKPFLRSFYGLQVPQALRRLRVPVLFLFAQNDGQIPVDRSAAIIVSCLTEAGNYDFAISVFPGTGHYFRAAGAEPRFVPGFLETVSGWISTHARVP